MRLLYLAVPLLLFCTCATPPQEAVTATIDAPQTIELQGHRGCRGLFPENTWPAFEHALKLGVTTLEMDVVLSADSQLIVSHEPWINRELCNWPDANAGDARRYNIHALTAAEVADFPCGNFAFERFPEQQQVATFKPVFNDVIDAVIRYCSTTQRLPPGINVEIKSRPSWEPAFQPAPETYVTAFLHKLDLLSYTGRITVQSFDPRILQELHRQRPELELVYLTEKPLDSPSKAIKTLGFTPQVYSPAFQLTTKRTRMACTELGMELVVWTVNEAKDMQDMAQLGVDGIITDYPNRFEAVAAELNLEVR